jgi:hypothetical protein
MEPFSDMNTKLEMVIDIVLLISCEYEVHHMLTPKDAKQSGAAVT